MQRQIVPLALLIVTLMTACSTNITQPSPSPFVSPPTAALATPNTAMPALTPPPTPREIAFGRSFVDVHYCNDGATPLKMIVVVPKEPTNTPAPVLLHLKFMPELIPLLVKRGFIVANVDWREPPDHKLPVGVQDVKCATRYLHANAAIYNLDPQRVGVFGCSRGGQLAALIGVTDPDANMEGSSDFADQSSRVGAVVMFDGIADFKTNYANAAGELESVHGITSFDDPQIIKLSPITYATSDDPPFFVLAFTSEGFREQAREMQGALKAANVAVTFLEPEASTHCRFGNDGPHTVEGMANLIADFFNRTLH